MTRPRRAFEGEPENADPAVAYVPRRSSGFVPVSVPPAAEPVEPPRPEPQPEPEMDGPPSRPRRALPALELDGSDESTQDTAQQAAVRLDGERPRAARAAAPPPVPAPSPPPVPTPDRRPAPAPRSTTSPDDPVPPRRPARGLMVPEPVDGDDIPEEPATVPVPRRSRALIVPEPMDDDDIPEEPATVPVPRRSRAWVDPGSPPTTSTRAGPPGSPPSPERPPRRSAPPPSGPTVPPGSAAPRTVTPRPAAVPPPATPLPAAVPPPPATRPSAATPSPIRNPPPASGPTTTRTGSTAQTGPPAPVRPYAPIPTTPPPTRPRSSAPSPSVAPAGSPPVSAAGPRPPSGQPSRRPSPSSSPAPRPAEPTSVRAGTAPHPTAAPTTSAPRPTPPTGAPRATSPSGAPASRLTPADRPGPGARPDPGPRPNPRTDPDRRTRPDQTRPNPTVRTDPATGRGSTARPGPAAPPPPLAFGRSSSNPEPSSVREQQPRPPEQRRTAGQPDRTVSHRVPPIVVDRLVKAYNGVVAVRNLSFTVEPGRITGFLGPNGAGKTTTLRILVGLVSPTTGNATFGGTVYADLDRPQETVGAVLDANFHPSRTGRNHLRVLAATAGVTDRRVDQLLERVGLTEDARRPTGQYSLGMRQRLAIAAALIGNPDYLILDEPANGLDPEGIRWLRQMLRDFAGTGRAVLVSSHLLNEVQATVDEIVVVHQGRLLAQMPMSDLHLGQGTIRARVSDLDTAGQVLGPLGVRVEWVVDEQGPYLRVHSEEVAAVGAALFNAGIVVHELVTERRDLEQEFFAMLEASR